MAPGESCLRFAKNSEDDGIQKYKIPACQNFAIGAHAILAHQDILGGWRVGLSNSSPVLNSEDEQGRAPD